MGVWSPQAHAMQISEGLLPANILPHFHLVSDEPPVFCLFGTSHSIFQMSFLLLTLCSVLKLEGQAIRVFMELSHKIG